MRSLLSLLLLVLGLFSFVQSQGLTDLPPCGLMCLATTVPAAGCTFTDNDCICGSRELAKASSNCVQANCSMADALTVAKINANICDLPRDDIGYIVDHVAIPVVSVAALCIILRFITKIWIGGNSMGWDDYLLGTVLVNEGVIMWITVSMVYQGFGKHFYMLENGDFSIILNKFWTATFLYVLNLALIKSSILFFYLRIFPHYVFRKYVLASQAFVVVSTVLLVFLCIFQCSPIPFYWNKDIKDGKCLNINAVAYGAAGVCIFSDFLIVILPMPLIKSLNLSRKKKIGVMFMFALGSLSCVFSIIRLSSLVVYGDSVDPTYDLVMAVMWSALEVQIAMITVCFPALRRLLAHLFPNLMGSTVSSTTANTHSKQLSGSKIWQPPGSFATNSTAVASGNFEKKKEEFEMQSNVVKVEGTFYVESESLKSQKSSESVQRLVIQGARYNITPELPIQRHEENWDREERR